jgi:hypothetical protein
MLEVLTTWQIFLSTRMVAQSAHLFRSLDQPHNITFFVTTNVANVVEVCYAGTWLKLLMYGAEKKQMSHLFSTAGSVPKSAAFP